MSLFMPKVPTISPFLSLSGETLMRYHVRRPSPHARLITWSITGSPVLITLSWASSKGPASSPVNEIRDRLADQLLGAAIEVLGQGPTNGYEPKLPVLEIDVIRNVRHEGGEQHLV